MEKLSKYLVKYAKNHKILLAAIVILVILIGGYAAGYRFGPGVSINRLGSLSLTNIPNGASVYSDQVLMRTTTATTTALHIDLVRGSHTIIVSAPGDYPWSSVIIVQSGKQTTVDPILLSETPHAVPLTGTDRTDAIARISSATMPSLSSPLLLSGGCTLVYVANNQIVADTASTTPGCTPAPFMCTNGSCAPTIVFAPISPLAAVLKYPGREDALLVQLGQVLYAIALDPRAPQFFAPVLTGTNPRAGALPDGTVVVQNNTAVYRLQF